jgi:hypothetical protein
MLQAVAVHNRKRSPTIAPPVPDFARVLLSVLSGDVCGEHAHSFPLLRIYTADEPQRERPRLLEGAIPACESFAQASVILQPYVRGALSAQDAVLWSDVL